ncbi:glycosyltransferase family 52, partial [Sulfitobacter sp.]|uniref:glycosyltransferase family 52 n=1 Tax=Sulfitobacter sp. TaxID=1903071 RepID=UPI003EFA94CF
VYAYFDHIECLNLRIHKWYQYDQDGSITKTNSALHIGDKLKSLTDSWPYISDSGRRVRIRFNLNHELPIFLEMAMQGTPLDHARAFNRARDYVLARVAYIDKALLNAQGTALLTACEQETVFPARQPAALRGAQAPAPDAPARWVFFPRTHFQVLEAIAFVLHHKKPAVLVVAKGIPGFFQPFINKLRETGIFSEVLEYKNNAVYDSLNTKLRLGATGAAKIFDILYVSFNTKLPELRETDIGVFFLEGWPERYYIGRKFHRTVKMEDGYCSTTREFTLDFVDGIWGVNRDNNSIWGGINLFVQKEYNRLHTTRKPVSEIHVSAAVDPALLTGDYAQTEVVQRDFKDLVTQHRTEFLEAMATLYGKVPDLEPDAAIILTQPLFFDYCTREENLAVVAHLISLARHKKVYLKPHPMDPADYSVLDVHILPARVPFEYLEAKGGTIDEAITFGSSALVNSGLVKTTRNLFPFEGFTHADVVAEIDRICYDLGAMDLPDTKRLLERHAHPLTKPAPDNTAPVPLPVSAVSPSAKVRRKIATAFKLLRSDRVEFTRQIRNNLRLSPKAHAS